MDGSFYEGIAAELLGRLRRLSAFTGHAASIGAHHEEIVREAIRPLLSPRFALRTGFAFAGPGVVSAQGDIIVVDEADPTPYLFRVGDLVVVHPRAVAMVVEVKTQLTKAEFYGAVRNLRTFRTVGASVPPGLLFPTAIFAFEGVRMSPSTLHEWYVSADVLDEASSYPQLIHVLREGTLDLKKFSDGTFGHRFIMGEGGDAAKARTLSVFLQLVRKAAQMKAGLDENPFDEADLRDLQWSKHHLRFGVGLVEPERLTGAAEQGDEADEAQGGTRTAS